MATEAAVMVPLELPATRAVRNVLVSLFAQISAAALTIANLIVRLRFNCVEAKTPLFHRGFTQIPGTRANCQRQAVATAIAIMFMFFQRVILPISLPAPLTGANGSSRKALHLWIAPS
jgi:hypothetical protein